MESAHQQVESLLAQMRAAAPGNAKVERLSDQISVLCRAAMEPCEDDSWLALGLTKKEGRLMRALTERRDKIVPKNALLDAMYFDSGKEAFPKIVDVLICKIRRKLIGSAWNIETVWGVGYRAKYSPAAEAIALASAEKMMAT